jgi:large subunit ribosomal protein LP1
MTDATSLPQNEQQELLCTYASLILFDEKMAVSADNITKLIQASGAKVEPYLPMLFSRALGQCNIQ